MFYQFFFSALVKRRVIINYKHGIYKLIHHLQNNLRHSILEN